MFSVFTHVMKLVRETLSESWLPTLARDQAVQFKTSGKFVVLPASSK